MTLSYYHHYHYYADDSGTVSVSVDGGAWQDMETYTSDATGYVNVDVTPYLGTGSNFRIRFMYIANYDWYWKIDNFTLTGA